MSDLAIVYSRAQNGIDAPLVRVEVHLSRGLPQLSIVGNIKHQYSYFFQKGCHFLGYRSVLL